MLHHATTSAAAPPGVPDPDDALLDWIDPDAGEHVLILGRDTLDLLCGLIRRGCTVAATLRPHQRAEAAAADLAIIPLIETEAEAAEAVAQARRALQPGGRVVLRAAADPSGRLAPAIARLLKAQGFSGSRVRNLAGSAVFSAHCPCFGRAAWASRG